jgi:hypothetical protein
MTKSRSSISPPSKPVGSKSPAPEQPQKPHLMIFPSDWTAQQIADHINKTREQLLKKP